MDSAFLNQLANYMVFGIILLIFSAMVILARYGKRLDWAAFLFQILLWGYSALLTLLGVLLCLSWIGLMSKPLEQAKLGFTPFAILISGLLSLLIMWKPSREWICRWIPAQPNSLPHQFGLVFTQIAFFANLALLLSLDADTILAMLKSSDILGGTVFLELFLIGMTLIGVGWGVIRNNRETLARLGLQPITRWQVLHCAGWALLMFGALTAIAQWVIMPYFPESYAFQGKLMKHYTLGKQTGSVMLESALVSMAAGVGEEIFFRGFIQPVLGVVITAALFSVIHFQYGLTPAILLVFAMGIFLGLMRQKVNTTYSLTVHFMYDFIALLATALFHVT